MTSHRPERVAELLHAELARLLREEVSDPRVGSLSVTHVRLTPDLKLARVHVVPLGGEGEPADLMKGLRKASGFLRTRIGQTLRLRYTPSLEFQLDEGLDEAVRLTALLGTLEVAEKGEE